VCGIGFTWPPPDGTTDAAPAAGELRGVAARVASAMAAASVAPLADALRPGALVVDVGAGTGLRARALADRGFQVIAMEPDPLEEMRAHVELTGTTTEVVRAGVADLGDVLGGRQADAVLMWHVLEHLEMPDVALATVSAGMRDGGVLSIAVPNRDSLEAEVFGDRWHSWEPSRHRWHFDERSLRLVLGEAGFSVRDVSPRGGWGYPASLAFSLAPDLDPQINPRRSLAGRALATAMIPVAFGARAAGRGSQLVTLASRT
jgi:SAM-dependent methyltransferase